MTHPSSEEGWSSVVGRLLNMCKTPQVQFPILEKKIPQLISKAN